MLDLGKYLKLADSLELGECANPELDGATAIIELCDLLEKAEADLQRVNVCGTCGHWRPHGKKTKCAVKSSYPGDANWAGCAKWKWRWECDINEKV